MQRFRSFRSPCHHIFKMSCLSKKLSFDSILNTRQRDDQELVVKRLIFTVRIFCFYSHFENVSITQTYVTTGLFLIVCKHGGIHTVSANRMMTPIVQTLGYDTKKYQTVAWQCKAHYLKLLVGLEPGASVDVPAGQTNNSGSKRKRCGMFVLCWCLLNDFFLTHSPHRYVQSVQEQSGLQTVQVLSGQTQVWRFRQA